MAGEPLVTVVGNLGTDADFKRTPKGTPVTSFSLANTARKQVNNEWMDGDTIWFRVHVWNREAAGVATTFKKGDKVLVTGRLSTDSYVDKEGKNQFRLEINADSVGLVPKIAPEPQMPTQKFDEEPVEDFPW